MNYLKSFFEGPEAAQPGVERYPHLAQFFAENPSAAPPVAGRPLGPYGELYDAIFGSQPPRQPETPDFGAKGAYGQLYQQLFGGQLPSPGTQPQVDQYVTQQRTGLPIPGESVPIRGFSETVADPFGGNAPTESRPTFYISEPMAQDLRQTLDAFRTPNADPRRRLDEQSAGETLRLAVVSNGTDSTKWDAATFGRAKQAWDVIRDRFETVPVPPDQQSPGYKLIRDVGNRLREAKRTAQAEQKAVEYGRQGETENRMLQHVAKNAEMLLLSQEAEPTRATLPKPLKDYLNAVEEDNAGPQWELAKAMYRVSHSESEFKMAQTDLKSADYLRRTAANVTGNLISDLPGAIETRVVKQAADRIAAGKPRQDDYLQVARHLYRAQLKAEETGDQSWMEWGLNQVADTIPFITAMVATSGAVPFGASGNAAKAATLGGMARGVTVQAMKGLANTAVQTALTSPANIAADADRMALNAKIGNLLNPDKPPHDESWTGNLPASATRAAIEVGTERMGGALMKGLGMVVSKPAAAIAAKLPKSRLMGVALSAVRGNALAQKMGSQFHGIGGEMLEERAGEVISGTLGSQFEYFAEHGFDAGTLGMIASSDPQEQSQGWKQLKAEAFSFGLMQGGFVAAAYAGDRLNPQQIPAAEALRNFMADPSRSNYRKLPQDLQILGRSPVASDREKHATRLNGAVAWTEKAAEAIQDVGMERVPESARQMQGAAGESFRYEPQQPPQPQQAPQQPVSQQPPTTQPATTQPTQTPPAPQSSGTGLEELGGMAEAIRENFYTMVWDRASRNDVSLKKYGIYEQAVLMGAQAGIIRSRDDAIRLADLMGGKETPQAAADALSAMQAAPTTRAQQMPSQAPQATQGRPQAQSPAQPPSRATPGRQTPQGGQLPPVRVGDQQDVMGVPSTVAEVVDAGGVRYEKYRDQQGNGGAIRVIDESGEVVSLNRGDNFADVEKKYADAVRIAQGGQSSPPTPAVPVSVGVPELARMDEQSVRALPADEVKRIAVDVLRLKVGGLTPEGVLKRVIAAKPEPYSIEAMRKTLELSQDEARAVDTLVDAAGLDKGRVYFGGQFKGLRDSQRGVFQMRGAVAIVRGLKDPNVATAIHEVLGHGTRRFLFDRSVPAAQRAGISDNDITTIEDWAGAKDGKWDRPAEERFARGMEKYLSTGKAPRASLRTVFKKVSDWFRNIYGNLTKNAAFAGVEIAPEVKDVFDRLYQRGEVAEQAGAATPEVEIADEVASLLKRGEKITPADFWEIADRAFGGTRAEGVYGPSDAYDALELGVNKYIRGLKQYPHSLANAVALADSLNRVVRESIPSQTNRSGEKDALQQFSTPPHYALAANWIANIGNTDVMLEPSAGTGGLAVHAMNAGARVYGNELSQRRAELLSTLGLDGVTREDAEQIHNILPGRIPSPSVVVMNPPFSHAAARMGGKTIIGTDLKHINAALSLLQENGRLVAIIGAGLHGQTKTLTKWLEKAGKSFNVRANVEVGRDVYKGYGTTFPTRVLVIDKPAGGKVVLDVIESKGAAARNFRSGDRVHWISKGKKLSGTVRRSDEDGVSVNVDQTAAPGGVPIGRVELVDPRKLTIQNQSTITGTAQNVAELMQMLEGVRNDRIRPAEQQPAEPARQEAVGGTEGQLQRPYPVQPTTGTLDAGERTGEYSGGGAGRRVEAGNLRGRDAGVEAGERSGLPAERGRNPEGDVGGNRDVQVAGEERPPVSDGNGGLSGGESVQQSGRVSSEPANTLDVEQKSRPKSRKGELGESLFEPYHPAKVEVRGSKKHPASIVESAAMSAVEPPNATYRPSLPEKVVKDGLLSDIQLEAIVYAGEAHSKTFETSEGQTVRRGFMLGDGTGVGKGRQIAGVILDNWQQGRRKAVWVSMNQKLYADAQRDVAALGQSPNMVFNQGKVKSGEGITAKEGIVFTTYSTLAASPKKGGGKGKSRLDQIVDWLGEDFDGVIAFDEAHNMRNALESKGSRGRVAASQKALSGIELQARLPNARVLYVSATAATEVKNLAYTSRLGLWGKGTAFANVNDFIAKVEEGGVATMELVARDMKGMGSYLARSISFNDGTEKGTVKYDRTEHKLTSDQRAIYNKLAEGWQVVQNNIDEALQITEADANARSNAMSQFRGAQLRFFNQVLTSMQTPSVINAIEKDLKAPEGRSVVIQLTNTHEASQERAMAKREEGDSLEDFDLTPRDTLLQLVENGFPTTQFEEFIDENGNTRSRPVKDAEGNFVENREAVAMREQLLDELASVAVPDSPLDMIINHFGSDAVSEITGRKRRVARATPNEAKKIQKRSKSARDADIAAFMQGDKRILVFSEAGGTGASYHADMASKNQQKRVHYLLQPGWRADSAIQGLGRTHRSNQKQTPTYVLVTTDLNGQKRFLSTIARRLSQLGALTKGQRQTGDAGIFTAADNLESTEAQDALRQFFRDLVRNDIPALSLAEFERQSGLRLVDENGNMLQATPPITKFLNRLLAMKIDMQNMVFDEFDKRLQQKVEQAIAEGTLDQGMENFKADRIQKNREQVVYTHPQTGAETRHVELKVSDKVVQVSFAQAVKQAGSRLKGFARNKLSGKVYAVASTDVTSTDPRSGRVSRKARLIGQTDRVRYVDADSITATKWDLLEQDEAKPLWDKAVKELPEYRDTTQHMITGLVLPIWDRLSGRPQVRRLLTDSGEQLLGRMIPADKIGDVLRRLGASLGDQSFPDAIQRLLAGEVRVRLSNDWTLKKSLVQGESRVEILGPSFQHHAELETAGVIRERIAGKTRYFVPTGEKSQDVLDEITTKANRQIVGMMELADSESVLSQADRDNLSGGQDVRGSLLGALSQPDRHRPDMVPDAIKADNPDVELRIQQSRGQLPESFTEKLAKGIEWMKSGLRPQRHIPNTPKFAAVNEFFRLMKDVPAKASDQANRYIAAILNDVGPRQLQVLERKLIYENQLAAADVGQSLRFGFKDVEEVRSELAKVDALLEDDTLAPVRTALESRDTIRRDIVTQLIELGRMSEDALENDRYFHQQVLAIMAERRHATRAGTGPKKRGFERGRSEGDLQESDFDYNTSYIEAEATWMTQALIEIEKERMLEKLPNRIAGLKNQATAKNWENFVGGKENVRRIEELRGEISESRANGNDSDERLKRASLIEELEQLDPTYQLRKRMAQASSMLERETGEEAPSDDAFFAQVKRLADAPEGTPGKIPALMWLKARAEREKMIRDSLGSRFLTYKELMDDTQATWSPRPGTVFYRAFTVPERIAEQLQAGLIEQAELSKDDLHEVLAVAGQRDPMVLPKEVVAQLEEVEKKPPTQYNLYQEAIRGWKVWTLLNPKRAAGYMIRNLTGDLDPVVGGAPGAIPYIKQATRELHDYYYGKKLAASKDLQDAVTYSVLDASMTAEEIPDLKDLPVFSRFYEKKADPRELPKGYFARIKRFNEFREAILRYATYRYYLDQLKAGTLKHYGGANKDVVREVQTQWGAEAAAAHLSRNLMGDYGNISVLGQYLRKNISPFWAFQEINLTRYPRLLVNAVKAGDPKSAGLTGAAASAALAMRLAVPYALYVAWNMLMYGDDEEELSPYDRANPHINLGRNADGSIRVFRNPGALGDFMEWFGLNDAAPLFRQYADGQIELDDIAVEIAKAPVDKFVQGTGPQIQGPLEGVSGLSLFPDAFNPRTVDRSETLPRTIGLGDEYRLAKGWMFGDGTTMQPHYFQRLVLGVSDPRRNALHEMHDARERFLKQKGQPTRSGFGSSPLKPMREAAMNGDYKSFAAAREAYIENGKSFDNFWSSLGTLDPVASRLNDQNEAEFEQKFLNGIERKKLRVAREYSQELRMQMWQWWKAAEGGYDAEQREQLQRTLYTASGPGKTASSKAAAERAVEFIRSAGIPLEEASDQLQQHMLDEQNERLKAAGKPARNRLVGDSWQTYRRRLRDLSNRVPEWKN